MKYSKYSKILAVLATLALAAFLAPSASAAITVKIATAGSTAVFQAALDDALGLSICGANHYTLKSGGTMHDNRSGLGGNPVIPEESANVWVTWDGLADGSTATVSCIYVAVDSGVGVRGYMAVPRATVYLGGIASCAAPPAPGNLSLLGGDVALPTTICNVYGNASPGTAVMNIVFSDVRPEDAQFQAARALSKIAPGSDTGLGYGNWPTPYNGWDSGNVLATLVGSPINSTYKAGEFSTPVWYELSHLQTDAFSGTAVATWQSFNVGAIPILPIVSNQDNSNTGFGAGLSPATTCTPLATCQPWTAGPYSANNINRFTAGYVWNGTLTRTTDILTSGDTLSTNCTAATSWNGTGVNDCSFIEIQREPFSGTYTTWEFCIPRSHAVQLSQEDNVPTSGVPLTPTQPLNQTFTDGSHRLRAIGTGEMVNAVCGPLPSGTTPPQGCAQANIPGYTNANRIGYAFWSYGNLKALRGTHGAGFVGNSYNTAPPLGHYLTMDGVDALFNNSTDNPDGALNPPICTATPCTVIPFTHIIDGTYSVWTLVQAIVPGTITLGDGSVQDTFLAGITSSIAKYSDFIPFSSMHVFRSHRDANVVGINARNGNHCTSGYGPYSRDVGQSAGGAVFNIQSDLDYAFDTTGIADTCIGENAADAGLTNITQ